jgi:hypothetical protein
MTTQYYFFHIPNMLKFNGALLSNKTWKKQLFKIQYAQKKSNRVLYLKLTLLLNFQWLYIHPFSQLQTASDRKK